MNNLRLTKINIRKKQITLKKGKRRKRTLYQKRNFTLATTKYGNLLSTLNISKQIGIILSTHGKTSNYEKTQKIFTLKFSGYLVHENGTMVVQ